MIFRAVGVMMNLSGLPYGMMIVEIIEERAEILVTEIEAILTTGRLSAGKA